MTTKNRGGRPSGSRNKTSASNEIKKALSKGMGLLELKLFLEQQIQDPKVTDQQKNKYIDKHWELMKLIIQENLKLETPKEVTPKEDNSKKEISKGENTENVPSSSEQKVARIKFGNK